jgi:hypothetical protein
LSEILKQPDGEGGPKGLLLASLFDQVNLAKEDFNELITVEGPGSEITSAGLDGSVTDADCQQYKTFSFVHDT